MTLYEITGEYLELLNMIEDPEIDEDALLDTLEMIDETFKDKAEGYAQVRARIMGEIDMFKAEEKRIAEQRRCLEKRVEKLENALDKAMKLTGEKEFNAGTFKFKLRKNPPSVVIDNEADIPFEFWRPKDPEVDKTALKNFLKDNEVSYAHLEQHEKLSIK